MMQGIVLLIVGVVIVLVMRGKAEGEPAAAEAVDANTPKDQRYDSLIKIFAIQHRIPFEILKAIVRQESNFDAKAWNDERKKNDTSDDAIGLMQIRSGALSDFNRTTAAKYIMQDLYNPAINLEVGSWYLGKLIARNGLHPGIEMFNVGETGYKRGTRNTKYLASVLSFSAYYNA